MGLEFRQFCRFFSNGKTLLVSLKEPLTVEKLHHDNGGPMKMWRNFFYFLALPVTSISVVNAFLIEEKEPPEFVKYPHLRIRNKPYPWGGVKSLFHNPHRNALPDGYETEH